MRLPDPAPAQVEPGSHPLSRDRHEPLRQSAGGLRAGKTRPRVAFALAPRGPPPHPAAQPPGDLLPPVPTGSAAGAGALPPALPAEGHPPHARRFLVWLALDGDRWAYPRRARHEGERRGLRP